MERRDESKAADQGSILALGLWIGLALFLGRASMVFSIDHLAHGIDLRSSLWRLAQLLPKLSAMGVVAGLAAALVAARAGGSWSLASRNDPNRPAATRSKATLFLGWILLAGLFVLFVSGLGMDQEARVPGTDTDNGIRAWIAIAVLGVVAAALILLAAAKAGGGLFGVCCGSHKAALAPLLLIALAFGGVHFGLAGDPPLMEVREISRALLEGEPSWEVVRSVPGNEPTVGVILPVVDWRVGGGERPALIMPPGSEVSFRVSPDDGDVVLRTAAGADQGNIRNIKPRWPLLEFGFEVLVNGKEVYNEVLFMGRSMDANENFWHPVGGDDGIPLGPDDLVTLRTSLNNEGAKREVSSKPWRIGFSNLLLERRRLRTREHSSPSTPNIILILQDTQRMDRLGCYGYERATSPNIDRLAARGTLYEESYATSSWTWPSTASVLSGLLSPSHGVLDGSSCYLARSVAILPESLQQNGYTTVSFSGSPLIVPDKNFDQGFEIFDGNAASFRRSDLLMPTALDWIRMNAGTRFFMYLHLVDTHEPHRPLPEAVEMFMGERPEGLTDKSFGEYTWELRKGRAMNKDGEWDSTLVAPPEHQEHLSDLYDACVYSGDHYVGRLLDLVEELGLEGETVIAFTSDHGEEFFEHGMLEHSHSLFGELVRVPLILAGPGVPSGVRSQIPVSNRNIAPTLAGIGGVRIPGLDDGLNLADPAGLERKPVFFSTNFGWWNNWYRTPLHGVRQDDWILHWAPEAGDWGAEEPEDGGQRRLYNIANNPWVEGEPASEEARSAEMESFLRTSLKSFEERRTSYSVEAGEETIDMLKDIGYLDSSDK